MRICIVGCGAVGSLFAANLATLEDLEVWAFDLNKAHIDAIKQKGLQLVGAGEVVGHPKATSDPAPVAAPAPRTAIAHVGATPRDIAPVSSQEPALVASTPPKPRISRTTLAWSLSAVSAGVVVILGLGIGLGRGAEPPPTRLGTASFQ